jgi:hypothetical protein
VGEPTARKALTGDTDTPFSMESRVDFALQLLATSLVYIVTKDKRQNDTKNPVALKRLAKARLNV